MAREIKFRAWDGQVMHYDVWVAPCGMWSANEMTLEAPHGDASTLMRFIGLRDKAGREIYEDDIVEGQWGQPARVAWANAYSGPQWCTVDKEGISEDYYGGIAYIGGTEDTASTRVLGNIYENPELIPNQ
jgi:uncharacterized phage protein (TIGR01671 family)